MKKNYREIEFIAGENIESAVRELDSYKQRNELACGSFNGQMLYSDIDDIDSAYKKITGKTKSECDEVYRKRKEKSETEKRKPEESIPELTHKWIELGKNILDEKYLELWNECVPIRLEDLYRGVELGDCLDIVKELNNGCELEFAKTIIKGQGHSGMSFSLVCSMVKSFCDRGVEFVKFLNK